MPTLLALLSSLPSTPLQEHFYLEPNAAIVVPGENDEYVAYSSTQVCVSWLLRTVAVAVFSARAAHRPLHAPWGGRRHAPPACVSLTAAPTTH